MAALLSTVVDPSIALGASPPEPSTLQRQIERLLSPCAPLKCGVSVVEVATGDSPVRLNDLVPLKPASVQKLLTTAVALKELGPEFRFQTVLWQQDRSGARVGTLYVQGGGAPDLTLERAWLLAREVRKQGVQQVQRLVLDNSFYVETVQRQGQRAYQTSPSALALSFNSMAFQVCPNLPGQPATVTPDPWEFNVGVRGKIMTAKPGSVGALQIDEMQPEGGSGAFAIRGSIPAGSACQVFYRSVRDPLAYFGETFLRFLQEAGVRVPQHFERGTVVSAADKLFAQPSRGLVESLRDLNHFSNNFVGEQILFGLGAPQDVKLRERGTTSVKTVSREAGIGRVTSYLKDLGIPEGEFEIADGSGLSHQNRLSPRIVTSILRQMSFEGEIEAEFEVSLSVSGRSGTLRERDFSLPEGVIVRGKTGTLDGVSALAGYLVTKSKKRVAFAILQNAANDSSEAKKREDRIVSLLYREG